MKTRVAQLIVLFGAALLGVSQANSQGNPNEPVGPVKPVEVVNETLTIEGNVNASLDEPVDVDVLSVPDQSVMIDDFVSAEATAQVWGGNPTQNFLRAFDGVLTSLQTQFHVNGVLLRDSGDPVFLATDVSCTLRMYARQGGVERRIYQARIIQSNDSGASHVVNIPNLDLRGGGQIRTLLEGPAPGGDIPAGSPVCFVSWMALGHK